MKRPVVQARNRRYSILRFMLEREEPVLTAEVASFIKDIPHRALQDLDWLSINELVLKRKYKGLSLARQVHTTPYCSWELTEKGRELARQMTDHAE